MDKMKKRELKELIEYSYEIKIDENLDFADGKFTPSEVIELISRHAEDIHNFLHQLRIEKPTS